MKKNIIFNKTYSFSISIIGLYKELICCNEYVISKQILKSGTSIGANVSEAIAAESKKDFIHKMSIASKEARETKYWLSLLNETQLVKYDYQKLLNEVIQIIKILNSIIKTSSERLS